MEPNPYQSPILPSDQKGTREPDSAIGLLAEIRDMQREMVTLTRSNTTMNRYAIVAIIGLVILGGVCIVVLTVTMAIKMGQLGT